MNPVDFQRCFSLNSAVFPRVTNQFELFQLKALFFLTYKNSKSTKSKAQKRTQFELISTTNVDTEATTEFIKSGSNYNTIIRHNLNQSTKYAPVCNVAVETILGEQYQATRQLRRDAG